MKLPENSCCHYLIPNFTDGFLDDIQRLVYVGLPYPINKPHKYIEDDVIHNIHKKSENYSKQLQTLCREFPSTQDRLMNQPFTNSHAVITESLLNFYNTENCEKPFPCDYNPYYSSGCLEYFSLNDTHYLMRPNSNNDLCVTNIAKPWKSKKIKFEFPLEDQIQGIKSTCSNCDEIIILLQCEAEVNLTQMRDIKEKTVRKWNKKFKKKILNSNFNKTQIGVLLSDTKFKLYDIETTKLIKTQDIYSGIYCDFVNENSISILNQDCLTIIDQRSQDCSKFQPELDDCNTLCSVKIDKEVIYIASRHHLLRTDFRYFKTVEFCTHSMATSPCYMDVVQNDNNKFMCLSSQKVGDKVLFAGNPISSLPISIPSISDTLIQCKLRHDASLIDQLDERLLKSTGGIKLLCDNNDLFLYSVNSLGDIFKHKISEEFDNDTTPISSLHYWINKLPDCPKTLFLSNVRNLSDARFALNNHTVDEKLLKFTNGSNKKMNFFLNHYNNVYNKNNLGELASNFVSIWDEEEEQPREKVPDLVPVVAPLDKVHSWIESSYFLE